MKFFKKKEKVIDPIIHDEEANFTLSNGVHILNKCQNVTLTGSAIVLESFNCSFKEISGKAKVQMMEEGEVDLLTGKAKIGLFKSGKITTISDKASITTINTCVIDYVKGKASIGTMNGGFIRFVDDKAELATITSGNVMFVRGKARIVTMIEGKIIGILDDAHLVSMLSGDITYLLNDSRVGTMNNGSIGLFADSSEVSTFNNGKIDEMIGKSLISANMNGEIGYQDKQTIILYSPQESAKRMSEYRQDKEEQQNDAQALAEELNDEASEGAGQTQENEISEKVEEVKVMAEPKKSRKKKAVEQQQLKLDLEDSENND